MNTPARAGPPAPADTRPPGPEAALKAASGWISQLARTLKTCRLYEARNPTVVRFREELGRSLQRVLAEHGELRFRFTSDDVFYDEESLYPARSRDDNLALAFYRDGVRAINFIPGIEPSELQQLIDCVLQVTGQNQTDDDLITLLWEIQLPHVEVDYVPSEGDAGGEPGKDDDSPLLPWPTAASVEEGSTTSAAAETDATGSTGTPRSDDWSAGESTIEIEAGYEELQSMAASELQRYRGEYEAEHQVAAASTALGVAQAYLAAAASEDDRSELGRFLPRALRQAVAHGRWLEARETLMLLRQTGTDEWSAETFVQELLQPISIASAVELLDRQDTPQVLEFVALARELGEPAVDWLNLVLAEVQDKRHRKQITEAIADLCRGNPERLAPWISDPRWFVVRNVVQILGSIGGPGVVGLLRSASRHSDIRVRQDVVAALASVELRYSRAVLLKLLEGADARIFSAVLHQLSGERDSATARFLVQMLQDPDFEQRPAEEKRAIHLALSSVAGDEVVSDLEAELHKGSWFAGGPDDQRRAIARILGRIGTPLARMVLERGAQSRRTPLRKACEEALAGMGGRG
ncbi:MAG: HEAT repeat domain-containing protein [Candidatus Eisenbacteria bacterium]|uniref:HEAT repeat domain-containing protein n=1 Tax=Eiseniibacteriota bacterium TaxID=2212470 RepID=A0A538S652_UNCEI|nr:MAG: HEAT repeat domain-containing protein [Candidatus Eisenbacteria bacterium]